MIQFVKLSKINWEKAIKYKTLLTYHKESIRDTHCFYYHDM